ncbi:MAG TPA: hypothetical protein VK705_05435 [Ferruginibacter sp.]|jgi:hypothetical protein|nr:hypothetical protein [Ferruginibacter sp.]
MNVYIINIAISTIVGGGSSILVVYLFKTYFTEKIKGSIKSDYDKQLEVLRGELSTSQSVMNNVLLSLNQGIKASQAEVIIAIKNFWKNYLILKNQLNPLIGTFDILFENEIKELYTQSSNGNSEKILSKINLKENLDTLQNIQQVIEKYRPFLNDDIWFNYAFLRSFTGRIIRETIYGIEKEKIEYWKESAALHELLIKRLTKDEFQFVMDRKWGSLRALQDIIEQKILLQLSNIISGKAAADNTLNQAKRFFELTSKERK